jgi:hypothetical protein
MGPTPLIFGDLPRAEQVVLNRLALIKGNAPRHHYHHTVACTDANEKGKRGKGGGGGKTRRNKEQTRK